MHPGRWKRDALEVLVVDEAGARDGGRVTRFGRSAISNGNLRANEGSGGCSGSSGDPHSIEVRTECDRRWCASGGE